MQYPYPVHNNNSKHTHLLLNFLNDFGGTIYVLTGVSSIYMFLLNKTIICFSRYFFDFYYFYHYHYVTKVYKASTRVSFYYQYSGGMPFIFSRNPRRFRISIKRCFLSTTCIMMFVAGSHLLCKVVYNM